MIATSEVRPSTVDGHKEPFYLAFLSIELVVNKLVRGNRSNEKNPFMCERLVLNLLGDSNYDQLISYE